MAIDWTLGMGQTFELVQMDAGTWTETAVVQNLVSAEVTYEDEGLLCSVTAEVDSELEPGYFRLYLIAEQGAEKERVALATFLAEADGWESDGKRVTYSVEGYSPLKELDDDMPGIGWTADGLVTDICEGICEAHCRAPVSVDASEASVSAWVAEEDETWLDVLEALLSTASMHIEVNGAGLLHLTADADTAALSPVYTFDDGNADVPSILLPEISTALNRADVPNRVELVFTDSDPVLVGIAENNDPESTLSTVSRGRVVLHRDTSPDLPDGATQDEIDRLAVSTLEEESLTTREQTFGHGYVPDVRVGSCVMLDCEIIGYSGKAVVSKQVITCETGMSVEETVWWTEGSVPDIEVVSS